MQSSTSNSIQPGRTERRDRLIDYDTTPPTSPQTPRHPQDSPPQGPSNMQAYNYHRGHQSLDYGRGNWRSGSFGAQTVHGPPTPGVPQSHLAVASPQRDPRYTQWRTEYSLNPPTTEDLRIIMSTGNGLSLPVSNATSSQYAYCLDRGNGRVTRLIPADMLPPLKEIPQLESSKPGMAVLPQPTAPPPSGIATTNQSVTLQNANTGNCPARQPATTSPHKPQKQKIYCTKWIHEGTCAFSHPGCRFKHVMPMDRETQLEVGLANGLPSWWKKKHEYLNRKAQRSVDQDMARLTVADEQKRGLAGSVPDVSDAPIWRKGDGWNDNRGLRASQPDYGASGLYATRPNPIGPPHKDK